MHMAFKYTLMCNWLHVNSYIEVNNKLILIKYLFHTEMGMVLMQPQLPVTQATAFQGKRGKVGESLYPRQHKS